jgi:hypothetical protein
MTTPTSPTSLPADWPTIADVYYGPDVAYPVAELPDFAVPRWSHSVDTHPDFEGDHLFFLQQSQYFRLPKDQATPENIALVEAAARGAVERIGKLAIRPFPSDPSEAPSA